MAVALRVDTPSVKECIKEVVASKHATRAHGKNTQHDSKEHQVKNHLLELLSAGKVAFGAQLRFGVPAIAELFARAGFDFVSIDAEHAPGHALHRHCALWTQ